METLDGVRHHSSTASMGIVLAKVQRGDFRTPVSKQKKRIKVDPQKAGASTTKTAPRKCVKNCRLIGNTRKKGKTPYKWIDAHITANRYPISSKKIKAIRRKCHVTPAQALQGHPGQTTVETTHLPRPDSTNRRYHRSLKHR